MTQTAKVQSDFVMTCQAEHEAFTIGFYRRNGGASGGNVLSGLGDAAHMCDAIAKDIIAEHTKRKKPSAEGIRLAEAVKRAGDAIWKLREKLV